MEVKTNHATFWHPERLMNKRTQAHPIPFLSDAGNSQVGVGMGCFPGRALEGQMGDSLFSSLHLISNYPFRTVLDWGIFLQFLSLLSVAVIHLHLVGCQRGQPTSRRRKSGVVTLSTEVLNHWTSAKVTGGPDFGQAACSWSCSEFKLLALTGIQIT